MAKQLYTNNAETILSGTLNSSTTAIILASSSGAIFPSITAPDYFLGTIYELNGAGVEVNHEIVKTTARVSDTLTVVRGFDGTTARTFPSNVTINPSQVVYFSLRWTAYAAGNVLAPDDNLLSLTSASTARTNLGLGTIATQAASSVSITGGVITGITDLTVADGGTGSSTASGARTNLSAAALGTNSDITSLTGITGGIATADFVDLDTGATTTNAVGRIRWDATDGTAQIGLVGGNVSLQLGQELLSRVYNAEATSLTAGTVVYLFGSSGSRPSVKRASNASNATSISTLGVVLETITAGGTGFISIKGAIGGLNLSAFTNGDVVWVGATAGTFTNTRPNPPANAVKVGLVVSNSVSDGILQVDVANGTDLTELHDVYITSPNNNDSLIYDSTNSYWKNANPSTVRTSLGLVIGTNVQAWDADLDTWAGKTAPTGTVVGTTDAQTLTNKTLTTPVISSITNTGTLTLPTSTDTLVGRATTDTLTNKTLTSPVIGTIVNTGTLTLPTATDTLVGRATTDTFTNKRIDPRDTTDTTATSLTPSIATNDVYSYTALATGLTIAVPTGTPTNGDKLMFRILDNGTTRTITFTGGTGGFKPVGVTLTASGADFTYDTTASKTVYFGCVYNLTSLRWEIIALSVEA